MGENQNNGKTAEIKTRAQRTDEAKKELGNILQNEIAYNKNVSYLR